MTTVSLPERDTGIHTYNTYICIHIYMCCKYVIPVSLPERDTGIHTYNIYIYVYCIHTYLQHTYICTV